MLFTKNKTSQTLSRIRKNPRTLIGIVKSMICFYEGYSENKFRFAPTWDVESLCVIWRNGMKEDKVLKKLIGQWCQ